MSGKTREEFKDNERRGKREIMFNFLLKRTFQGLKLHPWVPLARQASLCMEAHFLCVISRRESVHTCVCVCVRTGGCSSERSGVVLSARGGKECPNQTR